MLPVRRRRGRWMSRTIRKRFVSVRGRDVHYRIAGSGPVVVLLHDSPRSSALHIPLIEALSAEFTVIAPDTPGNAESSPLSGEGPLEIGDFAEALADTLDALGVKRAGFYGFHTSSKILLEFAIRRPEQVSVAIMDGLSLPPGGPDPALISAYMRPFVIEEDGSHIPREWTRLRDSGRWFPWYSRDPAHRFGSQTPDPAQAHQAFLDYFSAGPHYVEAYSAAMFYRAAEALQRLEVPTVIMAREDDVLFSHLSRLPPLPQGCSVEPLSADRSIWRSRLRSILLDHKGELLGEGAGGASEAGSSYLDLASGQVRVRRFGDGAGRPIVYLHELPGGAGAVSDLLAALADGRRVMAPDLPGCGLSDPLPNPGVEGYIEVLRRVITQSFDRPVDLVASFTATPIAARLAVAEAALFHRVVLDGALVADESGRAALAARYCPPLTFDFSGSHLQQVWQMLRDQDIQWPWYDGAPAAIRRTAEAPNATRLHRRFLDVLSQMERYGDPVGAALSCDARADLARLAVPTLVTSDESDPRFEGAGSAGGACNQVEVAPRPATVAARAALFLEFLGRP
jgi:pimeloyl-ACP methyl ester carboxylesterase